MIHSDAVQPRETTVVSHSSGGHQRHQCGKCHGFAGTELKFSRRWKQCSAGVVLCSFVHEGFTWTTLIYCNRQTFREFVSKFGEAFQKRLKRLSLQSARTSTDSQPYIFAVFLERQSHKVVPEIYFKLSYVVFLLLCSPSLLAVSATSPSSETVIYFHSSTRRNIISTNILLQLRKIEDRGESCRRETAIGLTACWRVTDHPYIHSWT